MAQIVSYQKFLKKNPPWEGVKSSSIHPSQQPTTLNGIEQNGFSKNVLIMEVILKKVTTMS